MSPPLVSNVADPITTAKAKRQARIVTRGPAPEYCPDESWTHMRLPPDDERWEDLDQLREEAWRLGITERSLEFMQDGYCPAQVDQQIRDLRDWINANWRSPAA